MNFTITNKVKITLYFILAINCGLYSQDCTEFLNFYKNFDCSITEYTDETLIELIESRKDTIPINVFDSFIENQKPFYIKKGEKKSVFGLGKIGQMTPTKIEDWSSNPPKIKYFANSIKPICYRKMDEYTNIVYLYCSFEIVTINLAVINNKCELISYLKLFEGNYNYSNNTLKYIKKTTVIKDNIFYQVSIDDTPEQNKFTKKYKQRLDGYFELLE